MNETYFLAAVKIFQGKEEIIAVNQLSTQKTSEVSSQR